MQQRRYVDLNSCPYLLCPSLLSRSHPPNVNEKLWAMKPIVAVAVLPVSHTAANNLSASISVLSSSSSSFQVLIGLQATSRPQYLSGLSLLWLSASIPHLQFFCITSPSPPSLHLYHYLPLSLPPSFPPSIIPSLHHSLAPSFPPSIIPSLYHSLPLSFPPSPSHLVDPTCR